MDEAEEKIIAAMARAACVADGGDPDGIFETLPRLERDQPGPTEENWKPYLYEARRHYAMHKAMMEAWGEIRQEVKRRSFEAVAVGPLSPIDEYDTTERA